MIVREKIIYHDSNQKEFESVMVWDDTITSLKPGVLVTHMWGGQSQFEEGKAEDLAQMGYIGFAIDLYGKGIRATNPEEAEKLMNSINQKRHLIAERMQLAVQVLSNHVQCDSSNIAGIGFCFGGKCVLDLARSGISIAGVISFHGLLDAPNPHPKKEIKTPILVLHGWEDPMALPNEVIALGKELTECKADWNIHMYGQTGHAFTNPKAIFHSKGLFFQPKSNKRSWNAMTNFLEEIFN